MSTGVDLDSLQLVQSTLHDLVTQNYIAFAILAVLLHDTVAYFEEEVKYFWAKPKSAVAILYFVNRYGAILSSTLELSTSFVNENEIICRIIYVQNILSERFTFELRIQNLIEEDAIPIFCVDYILFLRVCALYSQRRKMTRVLIAIYGLNALALMGFAIHASTLADASVFIIDGFSFCASTEVSFVEIVSSWCIPLAYSTLLMVLAVYKARQFWEESAGFKGFNLVTILIRDQGFYFLAVNVVCIANLLSATVEVNSFGQYVLIAVGNSGLLSIVGCRLFFNMKEAGEKGLNQGISYSLRSVLSNIDFAAPSGNAPGESLGNMTESVEADIEEIA